MKKIISLFENQPSAIFSLSMTRTRLMAYMITNACSLDELKLVSGELSPEEKQQVDEYVRNLQNMPLWIDDTPALSIDEFRTKAQQLVHEHQVKTIYIDDMRFMDKQGASAFGNEEIAAAIKKELDTIAQELSIQIIF